MRTGLVSTIIILLVFLSSCDKEARERRKKMEPIAKESIESLVSTVNAIDWQTFNPPGPDLADRTNRPCYPALMNFYAQMPDVDVDMDRFDEILKAYNFSKLIQEPVDKKKFSEIEGHDAPLLTHPIRDRILRKIDVGYGDADFAYQVQGNGSLTNEEIVELIDMSENYKDKIKKEPAFLALGEMQLGHCTFFDQLTLRFKGVKPEDKELLFRLKRQVMFLCECTDELNDQAPRFGYFQLESVVTANYEENGLYNLKFTGSTTPEMTGLGLTCCRNVEDISDEGQDDGGDQQNEESNQPENH